MSASGISVAAPSPAAPTEEWLRAARRARLLSWISLAWMGAEGAIAVTAGILAGSIALVAFGIDSAIEGFASLVIVWRFTGRRLLSERAEQRAQKLVAIQFFLLAPWREPSSSGCWGTRFSDSGGSIPSPRSSLQE